MKRKMRWSVSRPDPIAAKQLEQEHALSPFLAKFLASRQITEAEKVRALLNTGEELLNDPFLMADMKKGAALIESAIEEGKKITVFGDYDVDGISATVIVLSYLRSRNANADFFIPDRFTHGYGLKTDLIRHLHEKGTQVLLTVDCGISAREEAAFARSLGLTLVVTDHHACPSLLPEADALINPNRPDCPYPFKALAGCGVAWKLVCAVDSLHHGCDTSRQILWRYADLAALGTVADVMPLHGENRYLVKKGLEKLKNDPHPGLASLLSAMEEESGTPLREITCTTLGFSLAPRLNAAGRMKNAAVGVELFLSTEEEQRLSSARELCGLNRLRKQQEESVFKEAAQQLSPALSSQDCAFAVAASDSWHPGIIGIAASRISERAHLPCILISFPQDDPLSLGKGSGRSIPGFHLTKALSQCADLLEAYGGHELAAGLTVKKENLPLLTQRLNEIARRELTPEDMQKTVFCDCELTGEEITLQNALSLASLEPFGADFPPPLFFVEGALIRAVHPLSEGKHMKLTVEKDLTQATVLCFQMPAARFPFGAGSRVDLACTMDVNEYRGVQRVQLICKHIRTYEN